MNHIRKLSLFFGVYLHPPKHYDIIFFPWKCSRFGETGSPGEIRIISISELLCYTLQSAILPFCSTREDVLFSVPYQSQLLTLYAWFDFVILRQLILGSIYIFMFLSVKSEWLLLLKNRHFYKWSKTLSTIKEFKSFSLFETNWNTK